MTLLSRPYLFDEFFASGKEESISPFLTPSSRAWGKNLPLKTAIASAFCLSTAFICSFFLPPLTPLFLLFVYFLSGTPALLGALHDIKRANINIDVLMTLAALLSVVIGSGMEGALLLVLFEFSAAMETFVTQRTKNILSHLHQLTPKMACVVTEQGALLQRSVKEITLGTRLLIKSGEVVPLDGIVIDGSSSVNLVHLTGESHPIPKRLNDTVPAGAYNLDGTLTLQVTRISSDSTLARIVKLITEAQKAKPKLEQFLDRFGKGYAMTIIALSFLFALTLPHLLNLPYFGMEGGIYRALAFLIAASPCALIIATPTAYLSAISACARKGILLKGGVMLDALLECHAVAFDKTGTLTTGKLQLTLIEPLQATDLSTQDALKLAYTLERHAVHPIAEAITESALQQHLSPYPVTDFKAYPGFGLEGTIASLKVRIGHADFIGKEISQKGQPHTLLQAGNNLFAFHFTDTLKAEAAPLLLNLKEHHKLKTLMLTGDRAEVALLIGERAGIDEIYANLRPEDKLAKVAELAKSHGLIMVGDGVNDAPALARATVGIAMGKIGSATAIAASDVVFLNDDLFLLDSLLTHAKRTRHVVKQNLILACIVILLATTPALLGWIPLWLAVVLHEGGTVLVGFNSLRLLR